MIKSTARSVLFLLFFVIPVFAHEGYMVVQEKKYEVPDTKEIRDYEDVILDCGKDGEANFTIRLGKFQYCI